MTKKTLAAAITFMGAAAGVLSAQAPVTDSVHVKQIVDAMNAAAHADSPDVARKALDSLTRELDKIPGDTVVKLHVHAGVLGFYEDFDNDPRIVEQVRDIKALASQLSPADRSRYAKPIVAAYLSQAKLQANHLHVDSALATLDQASALLPHVADSLGVAKDRAMYKLVGTQAPPLHADYWVNGPAKPFTGAGPAMLMFTGEWCHSCRDAYPTIGAIQQKFEGKGLQTVLALQLIGNFDGRNVTPDQEVADNRRYYLDEHHFTMPIAIQRGEGGPPPADRANTDAFEVHYWPMFLVIDRHGVIRGILQGWDPYGSRGDMLKKLIAANL